MRRMRRQPEERRAKRRSDEGDRDASPNSLVQLQRTAGNRVVGKLVESMPSTPVVQRKGAWPFSQENSKAEFTRRTDVDNSLFLAMAAVTNKTAGPYQVIDIAKLEKSEYATLGRAMRAALATAKTREATPYHENSEAKLPAFGSRIVYMELSYFGGGTRLVVDFVQGIVYISAHYRSFYILEDGGNPPSDLVTTAKTRYFADDKAGVIAAMEAILRKGGHIY